MAEEQGFDPRLPGPLDIGPRSAGEIVGVFATPAGAGSALQNLRRGLTSPLRTFQQNRAINARLTGLAKEAAASGTRRSFNPNWPAQEGFDLPPGTMPESVMVPTKPLSYEERMARLGAPRMAGEGEAVSNAPRYTLSGLRDILAQLGSPDFLRLRLGVGHPGPGGDVVAYVLSRAPAEEQRLIDEAVGRALEVLPRLVAGEVDRVMNVLNSRAAAVGAARPDTGGPPRPPTTDG